jgi:hypothetical protein
MLLLAQALLDVVLLHMLLLAQVLAETVQCPLLELALLEVPLLARFAVVVLVLDMRILAVDELPKQLARVQMSGIAGLAVVCAQVLAQMLVGLLQLEVGAVEVAAAYTVGEVGEVECGWVVGLWQVNRALRRHLGVAGLPLHQALPH